jgi:endonuclease/exonuclease/phosphatase (EEP) superfamily protein YafD
MSQRYYCQNNASINNEFGRFFWEAPRSTVTERDPLKVATFNINNINKRLDNLLAWLAKAEPEVVSLQELKAEQEAFPVNALRTLGYEAVWQGERSWNWTSGTA